MIVRAALETDAPAFERMSREFETYLATLSPEEADGPSVAQTADTFLRAQGGSVILWTVWDKSSAAIEFYQTLGARRVSGELLMEWPEECWP